MNQFRNANRKRAKTLTFLTKKELNRLLQDKTSCIELVKCDHHLSLHPAHLTDLNESIKEILNRSLCKYDKRFNGIILGYKNVKILDRDAAINFDSCFIHIDVEVEFFIFKPKLDLLVQGVVNKISESHVGCLIHKMFNVSMPQPKDQMNWMGNSVQLHQEVQIRITKMKLDAKLPYIAGAFVSSNSEDSGISTSEEIGLVSSEKSKITKFEDDDIEMEDLNQSTELNSSKKKHKKHKKNKASNEGGALQDKIKSPKKNKHLNLEELEASVSDLLNQSLDFVDGIAKKTKKDADQELLGNQINFNEIQVDSKTKRKKHRRSKSECFDTEIAKYKEGEKSKSFTFTSNDVDKGELNADLDAVINPRKHKRSKSANFEATNTELEASSKSTDFNSLSLPSTSRNAEIQVASTKRKRSKSVNVDAIIDNLPNISTNISKEATPKSAAKRKRSISINFDAINSELSDIFNKSDDTVFKSPKKKRKSDASKMTIETNDVSKKSQENNAECSLPLDISELFDEQKLCSTMLMADDQDKHKRKRKSSTSNVSWEDRNIELPYDSDLENILGVSLNAKSKLVNTSKNTTGDQNDADVKIKKKSKKKDKEAIEKLPEPEENAKKKKKKSKKDDIVVDAGFLDFIKKVNFQEVLKNNKDLEPPPGIDLSNIFNLAVDSDKSSKKKHKSKSKHKDSSTTVSENNKSLPPDLNLQELFSLLKTNNKTKKHKEST